MNSEILGMSFDSPASPSITLTGQGDDRRTPGGWGFGWYPSDETGGVVIKNPRSVRESVMRRVLRDWDRFRSSIFICYISGAAKRISQQDTMPFIARYAGKHWIFTHSGKLSRRITTELSLGDNPFIEPVGRTDSEHAYCWLLTQLFQLGATSLSKAGWEQVHGLFKTLNKYGTGNFLLTDGQALVAYRDDTGAEGALHTCRRKPPHQETLLRNPTLDVDLGDPLDQNKTMLLLSTTPLSEGQWNELQGGEMVVARMGKLVWSSAGSRQEFTGPQSAHSEPTSQSESSSRPNDIPVSEQAMPLSTQVTARDAEPHQEHAAPDTVAGGGDDSHPITTNSDHVDTQTTVAAAFTTYADPSGLAPSDGTQSPLVVEPLSAIDVSDKVKPRTLLVTHETTYDYDEPVEYSTHRLHLHPVHDDQQEPVDFTLDITPEAEQREFEDVFGNKCVDLKISSPYERLVIRSSSKVMIQSPPYLQSTSERMTVPLVWMPWQRQMMMPYLLPPELPESELRSLTDYAMGFVKREDYDLLEALLEMNRTIFTDFEYVTGSTTIHTTPFEVLTKHRGVCQDFANLFICMARLLGIPARYRVGYINTGANYENKVQSEASHAWAELYLPWCGWYGFDPTNGCLVGRDHVRVAAGRNYRDASPTSGTIFRGGGGEHLSVSVQVTVEE